LTAQRRSFPRRRCRKAAAGYSSSAWTAVHGEHRGFPVRLPTDGPVQLSVVDYAGRAVYDHGRSLADRPITLTGFLTIDRDGQPYLTRMILNCCAADAQPVKVGLSGKLPPVLQPDTWFAVTGTYINRQGTDPINNGPIPFLDISRADPVSTPPDPYESW